MAKTKDNKLHVHVDKLSFTVQVPVDTAAAVWKNCCLLILFLRQCLTFFKYHKGRDGYRLSFKIPIGVYSSELKEIAPKHLYVQVAPFSMKKAFLRITLNGHPYNAGDLYECHRWLKILAPDVDTVEQATVTRIDFALDGKTPLSKLAFTLDKARSSGRFFGSDGEPQTLYAGDQKSDVQLCCYTKEDEDMTRSELRVRRKIKANALRAKIQEMDLPNRLKCYDLTALEKQNLNPWLLRYLRDVGLTAALRILKDSKSDMSCFKKMLEVAELEYFDNKELGKIFKTLVQHHCQIWCGDFSTASAKSQKDIKERQKPFDTIWLRGMNSVQNKFKTNGQKLFGKHKFE